MSKIKNFQGDLKALLEKYGASIDVHLEGDTHCTEIGMAIDFNDGGEIKFPHVTSLDAYELKTNLELKARK